jgi:hypothetical protein
LAELANESAVTGIEWDQHSRPAELLLQGAELGVLALGVARAAARAKVSISALVPRVPDLDVVRAASAGLARAAWEQAERAAYERAQQLAVGQPAQSAAAAPGTVSQPAQSAAAAQEFFHTVAGHKAGGD